MAECPVDAQFSPYEKMKNHTAHWKSRNLDGIKLWVATEKVHGANASFIVRDSAEPVQFAKRTCVLKPDDTSFFGVHTQRHFLATEKDRARALYEAVCEVYSGVSLVTVYGELFGGFYPHPSVPVCPGVFPVQREVVYCPDLKFIAYDVAIVQGQKPKVYLDYDLCMELFTTCGFLYAEPLLIGSLQNMLDYPLGFESKLPDKFNLPHLEDRTNTAEGIVIKPVQNAVLPCKNGTKRVIFKRKVEGFMERKEPKHVHKARDQKSQAFNPNFEALRYEALALTTEQRLINTISKLGRPESDDTSSWKEVADFFMQDVLTEICADNNELWTTCEKDGILIEKLKQELQVTTEQLITDYNEKN